MAGIEPQVPPEAQMVRLTPAQIKSRRQRNIGMAVVLGILVLLFYAVSFVKGPGVAVQGF